MDDRTVGFWVERNEPFWALLPGYVIQDGTLWKYSAIISDLFLRDRQFSIADIKANLSKDYKIIKWQMKRDWGMRETYLYGEMDIIKNGME